MKSKPTFAQRLANSSTSREKTSIDKKHSMQKTQTPPPPQKLGFNQFKQQHNELKNILKLFEGPKDQDIEQVSQLTPTTPIRNRLNDKKISNKINNIQLTPNRIELEVKENVCSPKWSKTVREQFKSVASQIVTRTEPLISNNKKEFFAQKKINTKKGIPNIGNTCYINALVQCLFHLPHFNDYFADQRYKPEQNGKKKDVVEMYRSLFMNVMRNNEAVDLSTLSLKRSVSKICSLFMDWQQEDAHEFMKQLLNSMHEQLNRIKNKPKYKQMFKELEGEEVQQMAAAYWSYEQSRDNSYIYDSLCGQTYNNIRCVNCNHQSVCFQNFLDLSLPIPVKATSLQGLLQDFFEPEKLTDYYNCGSCQKSSKKSTKTIQLWRVPKFLIIHLKRSQFGKKNTEFITIPQSLTLKSYMTLSNDKTARFCQYSLCGIIMHEGVLQGGHYWCNVKQSGKWFQVDDDKVKELNSQQFKNEISKGSRNAYILFYSSLYC